MTCIHCTGGLLYIPLYLITLSQLLPLTSRVNENNGVKASGELLMSLYAHVIRWVSLYADIPHDH